MKSELRDTKLTPKSIWIPAVKVKNPFLYVTLAPFNLLLIPKEHTSIQRRQCSLKCLRHFLLTIKHGNPRLQAHVCIFISSIQRRDARKQHFNIQLQFQSHSNEVHTQLIRSCISRQGNCIIVACCVMSRRQTTVQQTKLVTCIAPDGRKLEKTPVNTAYSRLQLTHRCNLTLNNYLKYALIIRQFSIPFAI